LSIRSEWKTLQASRKDRPKRPVELMPTEAFRALLCMTPMLVAAAVDQESYIVALGQGGFFMAAQFLPRRLGGRLVMGSIVLTIGLGLYLLGGNVAAHPAWAILVTFFVALNLSFLTGWPVGGPLALTFIMIYTAGMNAGSAERATHTFPAFALVMVWSTLVSLLPFWRPVDPPPNENLTLDEEAEQGARMGIGTAIATAISYAFGFEKLGWAPSAVGFVVRYDEKVTELRALSRFLGTIGGSLLAVVAMAITHNLVVLTICGLLFGGLNGLTKKTVLGKMPLFYTATILLLYSLNNIESGTDVAAQRVVYEMVGITVGLIVVIYPFPALMKKIRKATDGAPVG
jgi:hypothetical protein